MSYIDDHKIPGEASLTWNGTVYWPVTEWRVSSSGINGDSKRCAAVRFLMSANSAEGNNHIIAQYTAYTQTGSIYSNGYYMIRRLNSKVTSYNSEVPVSVNSFVTTMDKNIRYYQWSQQTVTDGHLIWVNAPYIVRDLGSGLGAGVSVTAPTFYVADSEVQNGVYPQTSVSATYTTPQTTYAITYNANGGSGTTEAQAKVKDVDILLQACGFTRTDYHFLYWNTAADGSGTSYQAGATYSTNAPLNLYAIWEADYVAPYFTNTPTVVRCNASGTPTDSGTNIYVSFGYAADPTVTNPKTGITKKLEYLVNSTWTTVPLTSTDSGSVYTGHSTNNVFLATSSYNVRITISGTANGRTYSNVFTTFVSTEISLIDLYRNESVGIGGPAPESTPTGSDGVFNIGASWDLQMTLANGTTDTALTNAISTAGYSGVYNSTDNLSVKKLLAQLVADASSPSSSLTCIENSGGVQLSSYGLELGTGTWPANGGWGWREEKWSDGRLTVYFWKWFATSNSGWQQLWTNLEYPTDSTAFIDTPTPFTSLVDNAMSIQGAAMLKLTSIRTSSNTTGFKMTYYNSAANTNAKTLVIVQLAGHWA